ncbi:MAG: InlB B-repeat-containing protein, partial [Acholeplasmatales bacterium]|nr:InlB B-repeat-containing protein [Acholeplasmatales bacterium]
MKASCEQDGVVAHYECDCGKYFDLDHNEITNIAISKLGHDLKHVEAKAATCTEAGNLEYWHCERCGKNYTSQDATTQITTIVVPALGHEYELKTVWNDDGTCLYELECEHDHSHKVIEGLNGTITHTDDTATCTSAGSVTYTLTLTYDGKTYTDTHTVQTGALEHDWKWVIDKEATATEDGVKHEVCSRCGETRNEGTVIPHAHTHELQIVQGQSATETEAGFKAYYSCSCGKFFEDAEAQVEIADLAAWKAQGGRGYVAPTGAAPHQHSLTLVAKVDATETTAGHEAYYVCSSCGKAYTAENDESTLIEDLTAWLAEGGAGYIAPVPHQHDLALVLMLPATETTAGYKAYYTCSCGKYFEDAQGEVEIPDLAAWKAEGGRGYIAPTGVAPHQHELTLVQGKEATTTEAGYKAYYECACGKFFEDEEGAVEITDLDAWKSEGGAGYLPVVVVPHTHEYTKVEAKAASCTEDGNIEYYTCNVEGCGKLFTKSGEEYTEVTTDDVVIPATGHPYGEWSVATLPSANATGLATRECATCHHVDELTLPVVNEENYNAVIKTPATCGAKGVHTYTLKENTKISFDLEDIEISGQHGELQEAPTSTEFEFNSKAWSDSTNSWTSNGDGNSCEVANSARGVQCTATAGATSKDVFKKVTKVVVVCSSNGSSGAENKIIVKIGDATVEVAAAGSYTNTEKEFEFDSVSGQIELNVNRSGSKSVYIKSIEIFYSAEVRTLTKHEGSEPSCEINGEKTYYECPICHKFFEDAEGKKEITEDIDTWKVIPELGHDFGTPTYSWNGGYCTATRVCKNDERHVETETVLGTEVKDTVETCTTNATGHLVATFENPAFESQSTEADSYVFENSALGHNYNDTPSRYSYSEDKWFAEYDCTRCDHVKKEETTDVKVAINNVGFATLQAAIDSTEVGDIRKVSDTQITESIKLSRDVKFVSLNYNGDFDFNGHKLLLEGEVDKLTLKVSASVSDQEINDSITVVGKKIVIDRTGEIATVTFELDGQAVTIHKDGTHTAYQTLDEAIAAFDGALDEVIKLNAPLTANGSITITNTAVLDFETHDVTATSLIINDGVVFTVFNGKFLGLIDENDLMTGKLVIKAGYHAHVIEGGFDIHELILVHHAAVAATCTEAGNVEYWECDRCHDKFADEECSQEIIDVVIPALGHDYTEPTYVWNGEECTATRVCKNESNYVEIETALGEYVKDTDATCDTNEKGHFVATFKNPAFAEQSTKANSYEVEGTAFGHDWQPVNITWDGEDKFTAHANFVCSHDANHTKQEEATLDNDGAKANWYQEVTKTYTASYEGFESITKTEVFAKTPLVKANTIASETDDAITIIGKVTEKTSSKVSFEGTTFYLYHIGDANKATVGSIIIAYGAVEDYKGTMQVNGYTSSSYKVLVEFTKHDAVSQTCTESGVKAYYTWNDLYFDIDDELNVTFIGDADAFNVWKSEGHGGFIPAPGHSFDESTDANDVIWDTTDVNKPSLQVRFECDTCHDKSEFVTVYTATDDNYDASKGVIVVNGREYTATVYFDGETYEYTYTRLKTVEEISTEIDEKIDALVKSLYSDYTLPTSVSVEAVDNLITPTELTYVWKYGNDEVTSITYTSPAQATELTYHLCVKNGDNVLIAGKEVVFTLVAYSSLNKFEVYVDPSDTDKAVIKVFNGEQYVAIDDSFRLVPNHEYKVKVETTSYMLKDVYLVETSCLADPDNIPDSAYITMNLEDKNDRRIFTFTANGEDLTLALGEFTENTTAYVTAPNATVSYENTALLGNKREITIGNEVTFTAVVAEGYRIANITVVGVKTENPAPAINVENGTVTFTVIAAIAYINVETVKIQTVTFNSNYGDTPATKEVVVDNGSAVAEPTDIVRTGYTLVKWQTRSGDAAPYTYTDYNFATKVEEDKTLYAVWEANKYTVTFKNAETTVDTKEVTYDSVYGDLPSISQNYYTFDGWFTAQNGGTKVTADTVVAITDKQTLYAQWTKVEYALDKDDINLSPANNQKMGDVALTDGELKIGEAVEFTFTPTVPVTAGNIVKIKSLTIGTDEIDLSEIEYDSNFVGTLILLELEDKHIDAENVKVVLHVVFAEYVADSGINVTYTFTASNFADPTNSWNATAAGASFETSGSARGVSKSSGGTMTATSKGSFNKVTKVVLVCSGNDKGANFDVQVGETKVSHSITAQNNTSLEFVFDELSGVIVVSGKGNSKSAWIKSVQVITSAEEATYYTVTVNKPEHGSINSIDFGTDLSKVVVVTSKEFIFVPANGYEVDKAFFGTDEIAVANNKATFDLLETNEKTINVTFKPVEYTITYTLNGGLATNPAKYTIETATFALVNPTKTGYTFTGWTYEGQTEPTTSV